MKKKRGSKTRFLPWVIFKWSFKKKKTAYINTKNVQKNRKIFKNLLMYDKKNFLSLTQKKKSPQNKTTQQTTE
jgi:hypoxanthine phosphoribosyltransferase